MMRILTITLVLLAFPALAHDDYAWINDGGYVNAWGTHCCGPSDCHVIRQDQYRRLEGGKWQVRVNGRTVTLSEKAVYPTQDWPRYCRVGCLFTAPSF